MDWWKQFKLQQKPIELKGNERVEKENWGKVGNLGTKKQVLQSSRAIISSIFREFDEPENLCKNMISISF